jgi:hypothetical protein
MYRILIGGLVAMSMTTSAGAEKPLEVLGESAIIKVSGKETGDELSVVEIVTPPGLGAPHTPTPARSSSSSSPKGR